MNENNSVKIVGIIAIAIVILGVLAFVSDNNSNTQTVDVRGDAQIDVTPDMLAVYFNVNTNGSTSKEAKDKNAEIVDETLTALIKSGLNRDEITTENFNVYEDYEWTQDGRVFKGYKASHTIKVKVSTEDNDKMGDIIDAGIDAGATLNYINFELSPSLRNQYESEATLLATQNARSKAESMAQGLGMNLGKIVSVSDANLGYQPYMAYAVAEDSIAKVDTQAIGTSIQAGEQTVSAYVSVTYKLK
ncbi:MAG: hypothetical protein ACI83O_000643 [Patescibacteria group bacterium]|jgi:uncharacterized protein YggE